MNDYYQILGVNKTATDDEIKRKYREKAKKFHPDLHPGDKEAEKQFKSLSEAYETLSSKEKRAVYDAPPPDPFGGIHFNFRHSGQDGFFDINDIFNHMHRRQAPQRNNDLTVQYNISLEDAYNGIKTSIRFVAPDNSSRDVTVEIPAGIDNGHRVRVVAQGDRSHSKLPPGDLYVLAQVQPHAFFSRNGQNLQCVQEIDVFDCLLGTTADVPTIEGGTIRVTIPAGTQYGDKLRIPQKGMRALHTNLRGDLYVTVKIVLPKLNDAQVAKLREMQQLPMNGDHK